MSYDMIDVTKGKGYQGKPSFQDRPALELLELDPWRYANGFPEGTIVKAYKLGLCHVLVTYHEADGGWHLSISHPSRYPNWDEIAEARYRLLPHDVTMAMILPPKGEYVNVHENCFQIVQIPALKDGAPT